MPQTNLFKLMRRQFVAAPSQRSVPNRRRARQDCSIKPLSLKEQLAEISVCALDLECTPIYIGAHRWFVLNVLTRRKQINNVRKIQNDQLSIFHVLDRVSLPLCGDTQEVAKVKQPFEGSITRIVRGQPTFTSTNIRGHQHQLVPSFYSPHNSWFCNEASQDSISTIDVLFFLKSFNSVKNLPPFSKVYMYFR